LPGTGKPKAAISPTFRASATGPFLSQTAYGFATAAQEATAWRRVVRRKLLRCLTDAVTRGSASGFALSVAHAHGLAVPRLPSGAGSPVRVAGYRITGTASSSGQSASVVVDTLVLGAGTTITELSFSSLESAPSKALEARVARTVASRLGG
jgi:hypothetical protein